MNSLIVRNFSRATPQGGKEVARGLHVEDRAAHSYRGFMPYWGCAAALRAQVQAAATRVSGASFNNPRSFSRNSGVSS